MTMAPTSNNVNNHWWRGAAIYQIYPRSFQDSNGDGIGDLQGITQRLPYIAKLGVDAVWISPFFTSPMKDFGYDVSDYCDVDPIFGNLQDARDLVAKAHALGIKVIIDQVLSHTSDQHPWFQQSRQDPSNARADWYVWADAQPDGTPPNNWISIFGGSAWQWDTRRCQYYLHNFLASQPDLNYHNPDVQDAILATVRFWLELGVDGFRLDTANFYFHDKQLRSNPARELGAHEKDKGANPYGWQRHLYCKSQPENLVFLERLRALLDEYPGTTTVGEIGDDDGIARMAEYTSGTKRLHMAYSFDLLGDNKDAAHLRKTVGQFQAQAADGWPSWALSNHDVKRLASRWGGAQPDMRMLRLVAAMQMCLRGSPCIYQGDELGLTEATLRFEDLQDPAGIAMWPKLPGRDGCRTPMPWVSAAAHAGFSTGKPWLPVAQEHVALAVDTQEAQPDSLLNFYRHLLQWRKTQSVIVQGSLTFLGEHPQVLAFSRQQSTETLVCVFNMSDSVASWAVPQGMKLGTMMDTGLSGAQVHADTVELAPWGGMVAPV
jgi:alpha-glucosidase